MDGVNYRNENVIKRSKDIRVGMQLWKKVYRGHDDPEVVVDKLKWVQEVFKVLFVRRIHRQ